MKSTKSPLLLFYLLGLSLWMSSCDKVDIQIAPDLIKKLSISSSFIGRDYTINVVLPEGYQSELKYETIYLLDGEEPAVCKYVADQAKQISAKNQQRSAIVVGIGGQYYRNDDYTPTKDARYKGQGGESENFAKFIEFELIPTIVKTFSVDTAAKSRVLAGHSLGGLFTGYMFSKHPQVFSNYLTLSPSFWWDDGVALDFEVENRATNINRKTLVYVGCGQFEEGIAILAQEWYLRLAKYYSNCKAGFKKIPNRGHNSSLNQDLSNGLEFYYQNK